jgi:type I restriction enzyme S subunit
VAKIESLSTKSRRARENLEHVPRLVEKYKQAVLTAAFRGDLSREWRRQNGVPDDRIEFAGLPSELTGRLLPKDWTKSSIEEAAVNHDGKRVPVRASDRAKRKGKFPYYGASGIIDTIDDYLFEGDFVLIGEDGANLVSRSTPIAFLATGRFWVNNHAHILKAGLDTSNQWLCWFINMIDLVPYVSGSAQPKLTQGALNRIGIPLPSLREQREIIRRIRIAFTWIDHLASATTSARRLIDHLDQAILSKAFQGELVPPDPSDETASVLLDRTQ